MGNKYLASTINTSQGDYRVIVGKSILGELGKELDKANLNNKRCFLIADKSMFPKQTKSLHESLESQGFITNSLSMEFSEELKTCTHLNFYGDLQYGGTRIFLVLIAAVASSGLIANDLTDKSIHLYLSRPISRIDYLIARIIPIFLLMLTITLIPNLVVFISQFSKSGLDVDFLSSNMWTLSNLILQAIFYSISYSIIGITIRT